MYIIHNVCGYKLPNSLLIFTIDFTHYYISPKIYSLASILTLRLSLILSSAEMVFLLWLGEFLSPTNKTFG